MAFKVGGDVIVIEQRVVDVKKKDKIGHAVGRAPLLTLTCVPQKA
jgi:hypothetical protein